MPKSSTQLMALIERIQRDLEELKRLVEAGEGEGEGKDQESSSPETELEGLWEGFRVDEALLEAAERSLFKVS